MHVASNALDYGSRCSDRLAVTFNVAAIVCDGSNTPLEEEEKNGSAGERGKKEKSGFQSD